MKEEMPKEEVIIILQGIFDKYPYLKACIEEIELSSVPKSLEKELGVGSIEPTKEISPCKDNQLEKDVIEKQIKNQKIRNDKARLMIAFYLGITDAQVYNFKILPLENRQLWHRRGIMHVN